MQIQAEKLTVGPLGTNCYLVHDGSVAAVIDPGDEAGRIKTALNEKGLSLAAILLTHGHFDHIGAVAALKEETGAKVYMHRGDEEMTSDPAKSLCFLGGKSSAPFEADVFVNDGDVLSFGEMGLRVMHTPGHSSGGVCYICGAVVFCGDLIFRRSIGRYDFGSLSDELASIHRLLAALPDEALLYPGHGPHTTVGYEKANNPYIN